ncbi:MAG: ATP-binding cassette domain-containing protein [Thermoproteota archaeon]
MKDIITTQGLTKYYDSLVAVDHISMSVKEGEIFGFLGPNGAGKTTTINMLTGVAKPTSGTAMISGFDVAREPTKAKEQVGVVPQVSFLYDEMTAWDNITFSAKLHSVPKKKRTGLARKYLQLFELYERRDDPVETFSGGMKKRLMIATALVHEPKILFLDEPTTGLDVQSSRQIRNLIKKLNRKGITVFLTTHYIEEADQLCQRVAIIDGGQIVTVSTPEELKSRVQGQQIIEVSFNPQEDLAGKLEGLKGVGKVVRAGDKFRLYVEETSNTLPVLFHFAEKNRLKVTSINTLKPTLEDAFVQLTGLPPEVMTSEKDPRKPVGGRRG